MNRAIFLDRDGTINVEKDYLYKIEDFEFIPGVIESLELAKQKGYKLIIITNQSGIARGYYTELDFYNLNTWMLAELEKEGIEIDAVYFCPHHPEGKVEKYSIECDCRKPKIGLFKKAVIAFNLDIDSCYAIGDKIRDCSICESTDCKGYLIGEAENKDIINSVKAGRYHNIKYAKNLISAIKEIIEK